MEKTITVVSILTWFGASSLANIRTRQAFQQNMLLTSSMNNSSMQNNSAPHLCIALILSSAQFLIGSLFGLACAAMFDASPVRLWETHRFIIPGLCHALGNSFTNICLSIGSISLTQVIKNLEPVVSIFIQYVILRRLALLPKKNELCGTLLILVGCMITSWHDVSLNIRILVFSCISLVTLSLRNVVSSKTAQEELHGPFCLITHLSIIAFASSTMGTAVACLPSWSIHNLNDPIFFRLSLESSIHHCLYQAASIVLLHRLNVLTHAITNVCKRMCIIITAQLFASGEMPLTPAAIGGIFVTLVGFSVFSIYPHVFINRSSDVH
jgi:uncharacterized membrane protein